MAGQEPHVREGGSCIALHPSLIVNGQSTKRMGSHPKVCCPLSADAKVE